MCDEVGERRSLSVPTGKIENDPGGGSEERKERRKGMAKKIWKYARSTKNRTLGD